MPAAKPPLVASTNFSSNAGDEMGRRLAPSLVYVNFDMPYLVSGIAERSYHGTGVIVDTQRGLVVVDRNTVPVALGDVRLTFGGALEVPGRVEFINPLHNLAVISYDPKLIGTTPVQAVTFNAVDFSPGEPVWVVGLRSDQRVMNRQARVSALDPVAFPLSRTLAFRDTNAEVLSLVDGPNDFDGLIVNKSGAVSALWSSFAFETPREMTQENFGILSDVINPMVTAVRDKTQLRSLEVELGAVPLATARRYGLPDFWVNQFQNNPANRRQVLSIVRLVAGTPAAQWLQTGDLLLSVDGH